MMRQTLKTHWQLGGIAFLAFGVRLFRIQTLTSFQGDQGRDLLAVWDIVANFNPTLLGPPSTFGPFQGPLYYYLLAPGLFFSNLYPIGALATAVLVNVFGLVLLYFFIAKFFSKKAAIISSFLFALSPLMTELGRTLLNAYFGVPFFVGALWLLIDLSINKKQNWQQIALFGLLSGILLQLHYNFGPFFLFGLIVPFTSQGIKKIQYYALYLVSFFIATAPQIVFEIRHEFLNTNLLLQSLQTGEAQGLFSTSYVSFFFSNIGYLLGWENVWYGVGIFVFVALALYKIRTNFPKKKKQVFDFLIFYSVFFLIIAGVSRVKIAYPAYHYYMSIFPILFLLVAIVVVQQKKLFQIALIGLFVVISFINLDLFRDHGFTMVANWNMVRQMEIGRLIANDASGRGDWNVASVVDGDTQALPLRYPIAISGGIPLGVEEYPQSNVLYLVTRDDKEKVFEYAVWEVASLQPFEITKEWKMKDNINIFRIEKILNLES